jgi:hypothetical protein
MLSIHKSKRHGCVVVFFALLITPLGAGATTATSAIATMAMTVPVGNCNNSGPGSLRVAVAGAQSGDTIDLRGLACSRITLTSGAIVMPQTDLTLLGPGYRKLTIDGSNVSAVLRHDSQPSLSPQTPIAGTLRLRRLSIAHGRLEADLPRGGCIFSHANLVLDNVQVHHCVAQALPSGFPAAQGGGVFASSGVTLSHSAVFSSSVFAQEPQSSGGGIYTFGRLTLDHSLLCSNYSSGEAAGADVYGLTATSSTVRDNTAVGSVGGIRANGARPLGNVLVNKSTFSDNRADMFAAGAFASADVRIADSTFSGNHSTRGTSGFAVDGRSTKVASIVNSTIVFNISDGPFADTCGGAVSMTGLVDFQSAIVAGNTCSGSPLDILTRPPRFGDRISGANNLINVATVELPADTISADPRLAPLSNNGGPTRTHALLSDSPAIDRGNNRSGFAYDQRGPGFPRVKGFGPDIGAFER